MTQRDLLSDRVTQLFLDLVRVDEAYEASRRAETQYPDSIDISRTIHPYSIDSRLLIPPVVENHRDSRGRVISGTLGANGGPHRYFCRGPACLATGDLPTTVEQVGGFCAVCSRLSLGTPSAQAGGDGDVDLQSS